MSVKIRVSIQVTVRRQDPKPKQNMERSQKAIPLYPRNVRRLPGPPIYPFFGEMANHLGWGAPKHTALMTCLYMLVSGHVISIFVPVHMEMGLRHTTPSTHARTI